MLGPQYGEWWKEHPVRQRARDGMVIVPIVLVSLSALYLCLSADLRTTDLLEAGGRLDVDDLQALPAQISDVSTDDIAPARLLHWMALDGRRERVVSLLEQGVAVDARDGKGNTALHHAAQRGDHELTSLLIDNGADVNVSSFALRITPLHLAARHGSLRTVRLLLLVGANANARSELYGTPLHWAAESGRSSVVTALLEHGASGGALDDHRLTPGDRARQRGHGDLANLLAVAQAVEVTAPVGMSIAAAENADTSCSFPPRMHRASRIFLDNYLQGKISFVEFRRLFSLPNSHYLDLGACLVGLFE